MNHSKDLSWLSAPAFFLILGAIAFNTLKQNGNRPHPVKEKTELSAEIKK